MRRLAIITLFLLLILPLADFMSNSIVGNAVVEEVCDMTNTNNTQNNFQTKSFPYSPVAELIIFGTPAQQVAISRLQRMGSTDFTFSVKYVVQRMAECIAVLSQHQERIYETKTSYFCHPACQYYVYTLRRILI